MISHPAIERALRRSGGKYVRLLRGQREPAGLAHVRDWRTPLSHNEIVKLHGWAAGDRSDRPRRSRQGKANQPQYILKVTDLYFAAFMIASGVRLIESIASGGKIWFSLDVEGVKSRNSRISGTAAPPSST
jgi:hypothetical protein